MSRRSLVANIPWINNIVQGDQSGQLKPPVDLGLGRSGYILPRQNGGTKSAGYFNRPDGSHCTYYLVSIVRGYSYNYNHGDNFWQISYFILNK